MDKLVAQRFKFLYPKVDIVTNVIIDGFRLDISFPKIKLNVELDGPSHRYIRYYQSSLLGVYTHLARGVVCLYLRQDLCFMQRIIVSHPSLSADVPHYGTWYLFYPESHSYWTIKLSSLHPPPHFTLYQHDISSNTHSSLLCLRYPARARFDRARDRYITAKGYDILRLQLIGRSIDDLVNQIKDKVDEKSEQVADLEIQQIYAVDASTLYTPEAARKVYSPRKNIKSE